MSGLAARLTPAPRSDVRRGAAGGRIRGARDRRRVRRQRAVRDRGGAGDHLLRGCGREPPTRARGLVSPGLPRGAAGVQPRRQGGGPADRRRLVRLVHPQPRLCQRRSAQPARALARARGALAVADPLDPLGPGSQPASRRPLALVRRRPADADRRHDRDRSARPQVDGLRVRHRRGPDRLTGDRQRRSQHVGDGDRDRHRGQARGRPGGSELPCGGDRAGDDPRPRRIHGNARKRESLVADGRADDPRPRPCGERVPRRGAGRAGGDRRGRRRLQEPADGDDGRPGGGDRDRRSLVLDRALGLGAGHRLRQRRQRSRRALAGRRPDRRGEADRRRRD